MEETLAEMRQDGVCEGLRSGDLVVDESPCRRCLQSPAQWKFAHYTGGDVRGRLIQSVYSQSWLSPPPICWVKHSEEASDEVQAESVAG